MHDLLPTSRNAKSAGLEDRLEQAVPILLRNSWATLAQVDLMRHMIRRVSSLPPESLRLGLSGLLVDQRLLPREQAGELDLLLRTQDLLQGFALHRKIGSGGMGTVFLATHEASGREVALKTINTRLADEGDFVTRFAREAKALASIRHPSVAEILGSGEAEGHCWLAMEFIDGPSLMAMLKEHKVLPEGYALGLVRQVAEGMAHVWDSAKMVHRDIKPENILVLRASDSDQLFSAGDVAKIIDFGLVKTSQEDDRLTQTGMTIGTPLYMSPEQVRGDHLDCRSDVYGLGATLYHLLTGATPYLGSSPGAIMSAHLTQPIPDPGARVPSLNPLTRDLVIMAMAKDPDRRFLTFGGMIAAIDKALAAIDAKTTSFPKLLRKPMVLKTPQTGLFRRSDAVGGTTADPATGILPGTAAIRKPPTSVIGKPSTTTIGTMAANAGTSSFRNQPTAAQPDTSAIEKPPTIALQVAAIRETPPSGKIKPERESPPPTGTARRPITEQTFKPLPTTPPVTERSAAFAEEAHESHGIGLRPWIALGAAVLIAVIYWVFFKPG